MRRLVALTWFTIAVAGPGWWASGGETKEISITAPVLLSPVSGKEAATTTAILVDFGEAIKPGAAPGNVTVIDTLTGRVRAFPIEASQISGRLLTIPSPEEPFTPGSLHTIQISKGAVVSVAAPETAYPGNDTWTFTTSSGELRMAIIPFRHVWGNNRYLSFDWGTDGNQRGQHEKDDGKKELKAPGLEFFFESLFGLNGSDSAKKEGEGESKLALPAIPAGQFKRGYYIDNLQNALVVVDTPDRIALYRAVVEQLDQAPLLVELTVAIIDLSTSATFDWQSEILVRDGTIDPAKVSPLHTTDTNTRTGASLGGLGILADRALDSAPILLSGGGFTLATLLKATRGDSLQILSTIKALEGRGAAQVMSRPAILTLDNLQANLRDTTTFYVRLKGVETEKLYEIKPGTDIRIIPHVVEPGEAGGERAVKLAVYIKEGQATSSTNISDRSITTQAVIRENESLLIAGSYVHEERRNEEFVPIIGKIPILGLPFKDKGIRNAKFQRMFLVTPRILEPDEFDGVSPPRSDERVARMLDERGPGAAGLDLNRAGKAQVQGALRTEEASGGVKPPFARLRRAWHSNQNP